MRTGLEWLDKIVEIEKIVAMNLLCNGIPVFSKHPKRGFIKIWLVHNDNSQSDILFGCSSWPDKKEEFIDAKQVGDMLDKYDKWWVVRDHLEAESKEGK